MDENRFDLIRFNRVNLFNLVKIMQVDNNEKAKKSVSRVEDLCEQGHLCVCCTPEPLQVAGRVLSFRSSSKRRVRPPTPLPRIETKPLELQKRFGRFDVELLVAALDSRRLSDTHNNVAFSAPFFFFLFFILKSKDDILFIVNFQHTVEEKKKGAICLNALVRRLFSVGYIYI